MSEEVKATIPELAANTNPDLVEFKEPPFYNLAKARTDLIKLIARSNGDEDKVKALWEVLDVAAEFLRARSAADQADRDADIARAAEAAEVARRLDEEHRVNSAKADLKAGNALIKNAKKVLGK